MARPLVFVLVGQSNLIRPGAWITRPVGPTESITGSLRFTVETTPTGTLTVPSGPGFAFARTVGQATGRPVHLVGGAFGGSSIAEWQRGTPLYAETVDATRDADGELAGVLIAQGEADARSDTLIANPRPDDWHCYLAALVCALRLDLAAPDLPVVLSLLGSTTSTVHGNWSRVQACQAAVAVPGLVAIDPNPVNLVDGLHWTDVSFGEQGRRMAAAYLALTGAS